MRVLLNFAFRVSVAFELPPLVRPLVSAKIQTTAMSTLQATLPQATSWQPHFEQCHSQQLATEQAGSALPLETTPTNHVFVWPLKPSGDDADDAWAKARFEAFLNGPEELAQAASEQPHSNSKNSKVNKAG